MTPIPPHIAAIERPVEQLLIYYVLRALATVFAFPVTVLIFYFRYHTMRYRFTEEGIRMSWGILFRNEIMLNYARIQDIHLRSNAIERWMDLARIEIETASGSKGSEMTLEGIPNHEAMRDFLYSRMRGAHEHHPVAAATESKPTELAGILTEIAAELRTIRITLEQRPHG